MDLEFVPPRCPNVACAQHGEPQPGFYTRQGTYQPRCRRAPVPRYRCSSCGKGFSRQTFRADYRDRRPRLNGRVFHLLISGVSLRQTSRLCRIGVHAVQRKFRKLARLLGQLNRNLLRQLPARLICLLDEIETYEGSSILPVTVPVLIEKESKLVVATGVAPIRRARKHGCRKQQELEAFEAANGKRQDLSRAAVLGVLKRWRHLLGGAPATLLTDEKPLYGALCREVFGEQVRHEAYSGRLQRDTRNPLFAINHTEAMLRDNCGRLHRRSWKVSKKARFLRSQLELFIAYRNWHRRRRNVDAAGTVPGTVLGVLPRRLRLREMLAWRQDWRQRSIHPASADAARTVVQGVP